MTNYKRAKQRVRRHAKANEMSYMQAQADLRKLSEIPTPTGAPLRPYVLHPQCRYCRSHGLDTKLDRTVASIGSATIVCHGRWDPTPILELGVRLADSDERIYDVTEYRVIGEERWRRNLESIRRPALRIQGSEDLNAHPDPGVVEPDRYPSQILFGKFLTVEMGEFRPAFHLKGFDGFDEKFVPEEGGKWTIGIPVIHLVDSG